MLALEMPHVSQRWVLWVPTVDEVAEVLLSILNRNDITTCCLVGHSYGSAVASRLLQQAPERIQQLCLIDPICFAMYMPTLLRNFMYEWPGSGSWLGDFMMISAARDLHVSATLSRRFFWSGERGIAWRPQQQQQATCIATVHVVVRCCVGLVCGDVRHQACVVCRWWR